MISSTFIYIIHHIAQGQYGFLATMGKRRCDTKVWLRTASAVMTTQWICRNDAVLGVWLCTVLEYFEAKGLCCYAGIQEQSVLWPHCQRPQVWEGEAAAKSEAEESIFAQVLKNLYIGNCTKLFQPTSEHNYRDRALVNPGKSTIVASSGLQLFQ